MNTTTEMLHPCMYVAARRLAASFTETYQQKGLDLKGIDFATIIGNNPSRQSIQPGTS